MGRLHPGLIVGRLWTCPDSRGGDDSVGGHAREQVGRSRIFLAAVENQSAPPALAFLSFGSAAAGMRSGFWGGDEARDGCRDRRSVHLVLAVTGLIFGLDVVGLSRYTVSGL